MDQREEALRRVGGVRHRLRQRPPRSRPQVVALRVGADQDGEAHPRHEGQEPGVPRGREVLAGRLVAVGALAREVEVHGHQGEQRRIVELLVRDGEPLPQKAPTGVVPGLAGPLGDPARRLAHQHDPGLGGRRVDRRPALRAHRRVLLRVVDLIEEQGLGAALPRCLVGGAHRATLPGGGGDPVRAAEIRCGKWRSGAGGAPHQKRAWNRVPSAGRHPAGMRRNKAAHPVGAPPEWALPGSNR